MKIPTEKEVSSIINTAIRGVDKSEAGPLYSYPEGGDMSQKKVNQLAFALLPAVITALIRTCFGNDKPQ